MIGSLNGVLAHKAPPQLTVDVNGVGYELEAPMSTFYALPAAGERVRLLTHLVVREDAHVLFGFTTEEERGLFRNLLKVSGVGPRMALAILSGMTASSFSAHVLKEDVAALTRIPGVGRKTAERLIVEMRDRLARPAGVELATAPGAAPADSAESEAFSALIALGYKPGEATRMLAGAAAGASTEERIRHALQSAVRE
ncbi:MAG TPA: Holliday junction branch migration protein RuvA [Steroidobacteraceae bacterium]|nr:Holliday junction branch migration protein RuvA [Steroidobacteraceae bacterium]